MKLFNQFALSICLCCILWGAPQANGRLIAQVPYLEGIGSTEIELMAFLDQADGQANVKKDGNRLEVEREGLNAVYNLNRGKVIAITFYEYFPTKQAAIDAYNRSMNFLYQKGVSLREVRRQDNYRVIQGRGAGMNAHLSVLPIDGKFRLDAGLTWLN